MLEFSEKYEAFAEEFPDAIVCWEHPGENHTEEGKKVIEAYNQNYRIVANEIMYEVGDMVAALFGDRTIKNIYDLYFEDEDKALKKLRRLLGKPVIYPDDEVLCYCDPLHKKIKYIELSYEDNFQNVWTETVTDSEMAIRHLH